MDAVDGATQHASTGLRCRRCVGGRRHGRGVFIDQFVDSSWGVRGDVRRGRGGIEGLHFGGGHSPGDISVPSLLFPVYPRLLAFLLFLFYFVLFFFFFLGRGGGCEGRSFPWSDDTKVARKSRWNEYDHWSLAVDAPRTF